MWHCNQISTSAWCNADWSAVWQLIWTLLPIWAFGAITGYLLPRPKSSTSSNASVLSTLLASSTPWRRAALAWHGAIIMRELWYHWTCPGTFRRFAKAVLRWIWGQGWSFDFPTAQEAGVSVGTPCDQPLTASAADTWYVTEKDLAFFKYHAEGSGAIAGASPWEVLMEREIQGVIKYTCWRRTLPNGKTEYKSVTYCPDATHEEVMDLYLDDDNRPNWDTMIIEHEVLEHGDFSQRQQVVRWIRRFPFSFISDREYVLARRRFRLGNVLYGLTKAVEHPRAPVQPHVVRMDVFYSMWCSQTVACPWGGSAPATKTILLHHEQFKIPENLARFAVKHGMWGFVRKLSSETPKFVEVRRKRCPADAQDEAAYGAGMLPNPPAHRCMPAALSPVKLTRAATCGGALCTSSGADAGMHRSSTVGSAMSAMCLTAQSSAELAANESYSDLLYRGSAPGSGGGSPGSTPGAGGSLPRTRSANKVKGIAAFAIASGLAMLMRRSASSERLLGSGGSGSGSGGGGSGGARLGRGRMRRFRSRLSEGSELSLAEVDGL